MKYGREPGKTRCRRFAAYGLLLAVCSGCITRTLTIESEPAGADIYINDRLQGTTPLTYDPVWYGGYRVTLKKEGYARLDDRRIYKSPKKLWIPVDLFMELMPFEVRDDQVWTYTMKPATPLPVPTPPDPTEEEAEAISERTIGTTEE